MTLQFGADRLAADPSLLGPVQRVAMATNDAARSATRPEVRTRALLQAAGIPLVRLFSPEHGLAAAAADGAAVGDATDTITGLPVVSLYGTRFAPPRELLSDVDLVLFDIPDVGARFYTYTWTLTHVIDACADAGVPLYVLDRPNPLGAALPAVEGPLLEPEHASFVGRHSLPIRHSLTLGEVARLWRAERRPDAVVHVIECAGWQREQLWPDTGLPFIPTSPALQNFEAVLLYPGLCLFEATNLSVARGHARSFRAIGAPWLEASTVCAAFNARALPGIRATPSQFTPATGPYAQESCYAAMLEVTDPAAVRPVATGMALLAAVATAQPDRFAWAPYPTAANPAGAGHLERLVGSGEVCNVLRDDLQHVDASALARLTAAPGWAERWRSVCLYA